jgi:hypothetical protein
MSEPITNAIGGESGALQHQCDLLRSLHVPGRPLVLPSIWDAATARTVVAAARRCHNQCRNSRGSGL